jgi:hypothetical protein
MRPERTTWRVDGTLTMCAEIGGVRSLAATPIRPGFPDNQGKNSEKVEKGRGSAAVGPPFSSGMLLCNVRLNIR